MASFMEVLQTSRQSQNSSIPSTTLAVQLFRVVFSCRAANKEVQRVIGTIDDGPLYLLGAFTSIVSYFARKGRKLADT